MPDYQGALDRRDPQRHKTWELRPSAQPCGGEIALIRKGSRQIEAVAHLVDSLPGRPHPYNMPILSAKDRCAWE